MPKVNLPKPLPAQRAFFNSTARHRALIGGIGAGKTLASCIEILRQPANTRGVVLAPTYPMLRDATQYTFINLFGQLIEDFNKSDGIMTLAKNRVILWRSADNPDSLRGPNLNWFCLDEGAFMSKETWGVMLGRLRLKHAKAWITSSPNGKANWLYTDFVKKADEGNKDYEYFTGTTYDNIHLPKEYSETLAESYTSQHARQELYGEFIAPQGAVMQVSWIREGAVDCDEYIIGVDLAISLKDTADDTAIVVVGKKEKQYFVSDIHFGKWTFAETQRHIIAMAGKWDAKKICVEKVAYQEAMVQELRANSNYWIEGVTPKGRDKLTRFMPVAGKYEHGLITHSPNLPTKFTDQLTSFTGDPKNHDDMVDALVYAVAGFDQKKYVLS